jgi:hypothetical protein
MYALHYENFCGERHKFILRKLIFSPHYEKTAYFAAT